MDKNKINDKTESEKQAYLKALDHSIKQIKAGKIIVYEFEEFMKLK